MFARSARELPPSGNGAERVSPVHWNHQQEPEPEAAARATRAAALGGGRGVRPVYGKLGGGRSRIDLAIDGFCFTFRVWGHRVTIG